LLDLVKDSYGKEFTLGELEGIVSKITKYYREHNYLVARAYLPQQEVKDGIVQISIVEGRYGKIQINNRANISHAVITRALGDVKSSVVVDGKLLERGLLMLSDLPGINAKATLTPGIVLGTTDLVVDVVKSKQVIGNLYSNNYGNRFTGQNIGGITVSINNPTGQGDFLTIQGMTSTSRLEHGRFSYEIPIGVQGLYWGTSYSKTYYELGEDFTSLDAHGEAKTTSLFARYALVRSYKKNLYGQIQYDDKKLKDYIDSSNWATDKTAKTLIFSLSGDSRDQIGGGGINSYSLSYTSGHLHMNNTNAITNDNEAKTAGSYGKFNLNFLRLQYLTDKSSLYTSFAGQLATKNLDSSEKMSLGGANGVRAYPQGEASGDEGYLLTLELRRTLPTPKPLTGDLQLITFLDTGHIKVNKELWPGYTGKNSRTLSALGLGFILSKQTDFSVRMDYAWKLSSEDATSDKDENGRFWIQGMKYF